MSPVLIALEVLALAVLALGVLALEVLARGVLALEVLVLVVMSLVLLAFKLLAVPRSLVVFSAKILLAIGFELWIEVVWRIISGVANVEAIGYKQKRVKQPINAKNAIKQEKRPNAVASFSFIVNFFLKIFYYTMLSWLPIIFMMCWGKDKIEIK
jgi:hypothetical protein